MKQRVVPTQREIPFSSEELIVSKTDLKGRITYANKTFMRMADFSEEQLIDVQHNIIRHPDMPRGAFFGLWQTLQQQREFFGFVKNMTANGDHYWVFADVRPDYQDGTVVGYFSVRRPITITMRTTMEGIYRDMLTIEQQAGSANAPQASWQWLMQTLANRKTSYERFILDLYQQEAL